MLVFALHRKKTTRLGVWHIPYSFSNDQGFYLSQHRKLSTRLLGHKARSSSLLWSSTSSMTLAMSIIQLYDLIALFGTFLETSKHQNVMGPRHPIWRELSGYWHWSDKASRQGNRLPLVASELPGIQGAFCTLPLWLPSGVDLMGCPLLPRSWQGYIYYNYHSL